MKILIRKGSALTAPGFAAVWAMVMMVVVVVGAIAWPGEALAWTGQPLAYVANGGSNTVSVIDTGSNEVMATIPGFNNPSWVAVAPDGGHVYVTNNGSVSVIETTTDTIVATVLVGSFPSGVTVTPNGRYVYVSSQEIYPEAGSISVIDTGTNEVVSTIQGVINPQNIAVAPDGRNIYAVEGNEGSSPGSVLVIDTRTNKVAATLPAGDFPAAIAVAPNGKYVYVTDNIPGSVSVIETKSGKVTATVPVGDGPLGMTVAPDGKHLYVASNYGYPTNFSGIDTKNDMVETAALLEGSPFGLAVTPDGKRVHATTDLPDAVAVIDTTTKSVTTVPVGNNPRAVAIIPPPQGIPFLSFNAKLDIDFGRKPNHDFFGLWSEFILSSTASNRIHPEAEPVKLQVGPFITTIPAGSFRKREDRSYAYEGVIDGVWIKAKIEQTGSLRYAFHAEVKGANLSGTTNPVQVSLGIGDDAGLTTVRAHFDRDHQANNN